MVKTAEDIRQLNERISYTGKFIETLREEEKRAIARELHRADMP